MVSQIMHELKHTVTKNEHIPQTYNYFYYRFLQASSSTRTWLDNVHCSGSESRLAYCNHNGYGIEDCNHSQDIALICTNSVTAGKWNLASLKY